MNVPLLILVGAFGLAFGSFGNVLVYRIHAKKPITGRSMCPSCHHTLSWFELFPVLSFVFLRAKCLACHRPISAQYPLVECCVAALSILAFALHPESLIAGTLLACVLYFLFLACVFDASYQQIPDIFTILIGVLAVISLFFGADIISALLGSAFMFAWFGGQWLLSRGRAVGSGDIFLAAVLGLYLGLRYAVMTLIFSYMAGAIILIAMILLRKISAKKQRIAYVPFLALGVMLTLLGVGDVYMRIIGF